MPTSRDAMSAMALTRRQPRDVQWEIYEFIAKGFGPGSGGKRGLSGGGTLTAAQCRRCTAANRGKDTKPELIVRSTWFAATTLSCRLRSPRGWVVAELRQEHSAQRAVARGGDGE